MKQVVEHLEEFFLSGQKGLFDVSDAATEIDGLALGSLCVPRFTNEFWTSSQRQGNSLHEVSYRACFKAELPRFFITLLTTEGDLVYDPFMGRGTTLLEGALLGRRVAGNDVNPLSRILIEPRLNPPEIEEIAGRLQDIPWDEGGRADRDLSMFYSPKTEQRLLALRSYLERVKTGGSEDEVDRWIRMVATNRLSGHSAGFFSVYTMPPNQAVSPDRQKRINQKRNQAPPDRDVPAIVLKKSGSLLRDVDAEAARRLRGVGTKALLFSEPAECPVALQSNSVDLVVTSPPFLDIVQYAADNWLRCWFNGMDAAAVGKRMTVCRSVSEWSCVMARVFRELLRILKPGGWAAFEVGEVRGGSIFLDEVVAPLGMREGLRVHCIMVNRQVFTKTANCWGVRNNRKGTNTNRIVLFRKDT